MQLVPEKSGVLQVDASAMGQWGNLDLQNDVDIQENGYLAVYISNEQATDVFFDNVQVLHYKVRLLEEQHYYPFGLTMRAGSNDPVPNRYLWQGKELPCGQARPWG